MGTLLGWARFRGARGRHVPPRLRAVKYLLLTVIAAIVWVIVRITQSGSKKHSRY